eukprot:Skav202206  [mRNA]  locus=scaffold5420:4020:4238:- [translate_table: standard]
MLPLHMLPLHVMLEFPRGRRFGKAFIIWKSNRATESRDRRMTKELELRRLRGAQLVRGGGRRTRSVAVPKDG